MGLSTSKSRLYYLYVLQVDGGGWYIGATQNFERRMRSHFGKDGSVATKERQAIAIHEVFELHNYQIHTDCAYERAEVIVAHRYANQYGMEAVRGGKHGKGWKDTPSPGNLRDIERYRKFSTTLEGEKLIESMRKVEPMHLLSERVRKLCGFAIGALGGETSAASK